MVKRAKKRAAKNVNKGKRVKIEKGMSLKRGEEEKLSKKRGSSNIGKYKGVAKGKFCGSSGGAAPGTYPVDTKKRCSAALSYAHNAPNPSGIRKCVARKCGAKRSPSTGRKT